MASSKCIWPRMAIRRAIDAGHGRHDAVGTQCEQRKRFEKRRIGFTGPQAEDDDAAQCGDGEEFIQPRGDDAQHHLAAVDAVQFLGSAEVGLLNRSHRTKRDELEKTANGVLNDGGGGRSEVVNGGAVLAQSTAG